MANGIDPDEMQLLHTREVIQDLDGIVLRDDPAAGTLTFDLVALVAPRPRFPHSPPVSRSCFPAARHRALTPRNGPNHLWVVHPHTHTHAHTLATTDLHP